jgi:hypothetical protein
MPPGGGDRRGVVNECSGCGLDFGSTHAFDKHRIGKHAYTSTEGLRMDPPKEDGRRCLSVIEMLDGGWHQDARGRWRTPVRIPFDERGVDGEALRGVA